jgi:putative transposase
MLSVLELPKTTGSYWENEKQTLEEKYASVKPLIDEVIDKYPEYGRPRITEELQQTYGLDINHKVVGKLLRTWDVALKRAARETGLSPVEKAIKQAGSNANLVQKRLNEDRPIELFEILYTDFTTVEFDGGSRSAKLMPMIGHKSKFIFGWALAPRRNQTLACRAWEDAKKTLQSFDAADPERIVHQDQDSVYTSNRWVDQLLEDGARLSYSTNGAKGNTYMESFNGHFKKPIESLVIEAESIPDVKEVIRNRVTKFNENRRHSSLGQIAPRTYIENQQSTS